MADEFFSSNVENSMNCENDDNLLVHKQGQDMILNLGLGVKSTFDETPTPTQFFKNCEEVGLFQDLQNVNPFEEAFKKAVEAVHSGQQISLENSQQSNPSDDTLQTPNVFPLIADVPHVEQQDEWMKSKNLELFKSDANKHRSLENIKIDESAITINHISPEVILGQSESAISVKNSVGFKRQDSSENNILLNIPEGHFVQFIAAAEINQRPCNFVIVKHSNSIYPKSAKEKLRQSLSDKKSDKLLQKVPISKYSSRKNINSLSNKFSKFSKNALKLISKFENSNKECHDLEANESKKGKKKSKELYSKESRSEFLARSRAASSRCREKKKMYVLYLEKVNAELSLANKNLQLTNYSLRKQLQELQAELLKHQNCGHSCSKSETALSQIEKVIVNDKNLLSRNLEKYEQQSVLTKSNEIEVKKNSAMTSASTSVKIERTKTSLTEEVITLPYFCSLDVAEIVLDDQVQENEVPLNECNKSPGIIVRFNSVGNDLSDDFPPTSYFTLDFENTDENVKKIYKEHSYFFIKTNLGVDKRLNDFKNLGHSLSKAVSSNQDLSNFKLELNRTDNINNQLNSMIQPPIVLLKPFKKRSLQKKNPKKHSRC